VQAGRRWRGPNNAVFQFQFKTIKLPNIVNGKHCEELPDCGPGLHIPAPRESSRKTVHILQNLFFTLPGALLNRV
jgi:hypothetical protein